VTDNRRPWMLLTPALVVHQGLNCRLDRLAADRLALLHLLREGAEACVRLETALGHRLQTICSPLPHCALSSISKRTISMAHRVGVKRYRTTYR
jgi:hypothetical protein